MGCSGCEMFVMWDVQNIGCLGCGMFAMWDIEDVGCLRRRMFGMFHVGYRMFAGMWDVNLQKSFIRRK